MDEVTRERILELGMRAPNVDNAQPFYFRWAGDELRIYRDPGRDRKRGNAGYYVSMVGLGCLLEYLAIAASGEGLASDDALTVDWRDREEPWAVVTFRRSDGKTDELLEGLRLRASDRRLYQGGDLSAPVFQQVLEDSASNEDVQLYFQGQPGETLIDYILRCEEFMWEDEYILPEMLSWVRWSRSEVESSRDGMPWQSMGVSYLVSRLMRLVASSTLVRGLARRSGGPMEAQKRNLEAQIRSSAALGCFAIRDTQPESMLEVGRVFVRAWVRLNMAGYGVQVMANPSLHVLQTVAEVIPEDYPEKNKRVFEEGRGVLVRAFGCGEGEIPAWMFRTGKSPVLPEEMRTLRRTVGEVVRTIEDA